LISSIQWRHTKLALTPILDFFLLSEVATTWQTDGAAHKLKPSVKFTNSGLSFFSILFFISIFMLFYFSIFLFLEQLGLRLIGHAVTPVTTWWCSHKTDHETWRNLVEDSRTDDIIQHGHYMLTSWTTHGCLG